MAKIYKTIYSDYQMKSSVYEAYFAEDLNNQELNIINVFPDVRYQEILGFGGAVTEAVGSILNDMPDKDASKILNMCFGNEGLNYSHIRTHIDSCDFSLSEYCSIDNEHYEKLNLKRDEKNIIPWIKRAQEYTNAPLEVILSPWSPPAFMKSNNSRRHGGKLLKQYYRTYAEYICQYIKSYIEININVTRLTIQNEPNATQEWDSCLYTVEEEKDFLQNYLYPVLKQNSIGHIKIYFWDHNKERIYERTKGIYDSTTKDMITGAAFHWYSGDHFESLDIIRHKYPKLELIFTEGCIEYSRNSKDADLDHAQKYAHEMIGNFNSGLNMFIDWNIILYSDGGPNYVNNFCAAPIMYNKTNGEFEIHLSYFYIWHFSHFLKKGAVRIGTSKFTDKLETVSFMNTNNEIIVVVMNKNSYPIDYVIRKEESLLKETIEGNAIATLIL